MNFDVLWRYAPALVSGFGVTVLCWGAGGALGLRPRLHRLAALSPAVRAAALGCCAP